jgi:dynactin complex subunit
VRSQNQRISALQIQASRLNEQIGDTQTLLNDSGRLDASIDALSKTVNVLQRQLLQMKHKLDDLKAGIEEQKDRTLRVKRFKNQLGMTKEGRDQLMSMLAETVFDMQNLLIDVKQKRQALLEG